MRDMLSRHHQMDAGMGLCRGHVGDGETGMRIGRTQDKSVQHAGRSKVVGILPLAGDEGDIFLPPHSSAHAEFGLNNLVHDEVPVVSDEGKRAGHPKMPAVVASL